MSDDAAVYLDYHQDVVKKLEKQIAQLTQDLVKARLESCAILQTVKCQIASLEADCRCGNISSVLINDVLDGLLSDSIGDTRE